jgi:hypothetical protein
MKESVPFTGDSHRHTLRWLGDPGQSTLANREIRIRLEAKDAAIYSIAVGSEEQAKRYWDFRLPYFLPMRHSKDRL